MDRATNIVYSTANGSLIRSLDYAYDASSMITNKTIVDDASSFVAYDYEYDSLNRLVGESTSTNGHSMFDIQYSHDLAGNRLTRTVDGLGVAYTLGTGNRLASAGTAATIDLQGSSSEPIGTDDRWGELWVSNLNAGIGWVPGTDGFDFRVDDLSIVPGTNNLVAAIRDQAGNTDYTTNTVHLSAASTNMQYAYDAAGCLTNLNGLALDWDERYRLTSVSSATSAVSYNYDVLNRRTSRIEGGITNHFVYNVSQVAADLDGSGNLLRTYVWGAGIDNLLCFTDHATSNTYYAIKDHQNSVIALTDDNGTVVETYEYDAYGNTKVFSATGTELTASASGNHYCFQGREIDWDTGLYYFRARWYDPGTGRWLSKDPIGISGGLNLYAFCGNNPVNFIDPSGLCEQGVQTTTFGLMLSAIAGGGATFGFGIAINSDGSIQFYSSFGGGAGIDISASFEVGRGDQAMLSGNSYNVSAGAYGAQGTHSFDDNGNSMTAASYGVGTGSVGSGTGGGSTTFSTPPIGGYVDLGDTSYSNYIPSGP